ncbi:AAA family ATPase [Azospirillum sp. RWY-5-1]|uniref:AAA family ATPase n=1 Tax=Azospirillum oleiclasticum TaxID=2735135 RepID=A0ABX2TBL5_9PROT|nr:AAA family ATPase [Azospirillum oleiclasticum]NYZ20538.1 AAA family ATPase [Azospirillum oleiclasticum]
MATNRRFTGIGWATAKRLWATFGERLYDLIRYRDYRALADAVGPDSAVTIIEGFGLLAEEVEVFAWLDRYGVSPRTAAAVAAMWGAKAIERIRENPYTLALLEPWKDVDLRALRLGVSLTDRRRLLAAVEEAMAARFARGDLAATRAQMHPHLRQLLGPGAASEARRAIDLAVEAGRLLERPDGLLQARGPHFMERELERMVAERLARETMHSPFDAVEAAIAEVEREEGYRLTPRQREAVHMAVTAPLSVIAGGAGTGKTTVVKAILAASRRRLLALPAEERRAMSFPQVAVAGRAAKRIAEATGHEAMTLDRFRRRLENGGRGMQRGLLVFDESSMLDVPSVYRVLRMVPPSVDVLFIGDEAQLPPIGPGLLFHRLVEADTVPRVRLDVIHRQRAGTGIPAVAAEIRAGRLPDLPQFDPATPLAPGVFVLPANGDDVGGHVLDVWKAMVGPPPQAGRTQALHDLDVQILCATKAGEGGLVALNRTIEVQYMAHQPKVADWGLSVGSKVLWLKNAYTKAPVLDRDGNQVLGEEGKPLFHGFMNGALGAVQRPTKKGAWVSFDDGAADEIGPVDLQDLTHGWAISVHKAQGSAFRRVIVPVTKSRLLDRTLVYTAVTRAVDTVVLVGSMELLRAAVENSPKALTKTTTLDFSSAESGWN